MMAAKDIRVIVVEDEDLTREAVVRLVLERPELKLVGVAKDGNEAVELMEATDFDLVFLDVELPELSGFAVLERLSKEPYVIFTTGHRERALDAFEVGAIDFLTKPVSRERFAISVDRALRFFHREQEGQPPLRRHGLFVTEKENHFLVPFASIIYVSSHENYCAIHADDRDYVTYSSLKAMEARLPPQDFIRVYKQFLVNVSRIGRIQSDQSGNFTVFLRDEDETALPVGRTYLPRVRELMR